MKQFLAALVCAIAPLLAPAPAAADDGDAQARAQQVIDLMQARDFEAVWQSFTPSMQTAVSVDTLEQGWSSLAGPLGRLHARGTPQTHGRGDPAVVVTPLQFERGTLNAIVSLDTNGRVSGLRLQPAAPDASQPPPPPADADFDERDFGIGTGADALPGTLSMPGGDGPFPAVVLVHGSGPQDRDQTVGPNRPFLDIAHGLAARGVAVLRYDKRTLVHRIAAAADPDFGIDQETTDDAVAAVAALRAAPGIDPDRVFVFGHSLGGLAAPRIVQRAPGAAGAIVFAAPSRPLLDVLPEQIAGMARLQGGDQAGTQAMLEQLAASTARIRAGEDLPAAQAPLGVPAAYWRSVEAVDAVADAAAATQPLLVLHGGRDIQVTDTDWQGWKTAFAGDRRVTLVRHPALGHLGIAVEGDDPLAQYTQPGKVDEGFIDGVAQWIHAR